MIFAGYFLGNYIKNIDKFILPIVVFIIIISLIPILAQFIRKNKRKTGILDSMDEKDVV